MSQISHSQVDVITIVFLDQPLADVCFLGACGKPSQLVVVKSEFCLFWARQVLTPLLNQFNPNIFFRVYSSNAKGRSRSVTFDGYTLAMADRSEGKKLNPNHYCVVLGQ